jgi:hypothetical protein
VRDEVRRAAGGPGGPLVALRVLIARGGEAKRRGLHIEMVFTGPLYAHYKNGYRAANCAFHRRVFPGRALPGWLHADAWN